MINEVYLTLQTILNKENRGYVSPTEFNLLAKQVQEEIFRGYFEDENTDKNKQNRGLVNPGYANLPLNQRQRVTQFSATSTLNYNSTLLGYPLETDTYLIEDKGLTLSSNGRVVEEQEKSDMGYAALSLSKPSETYPVYEMFKQYIRVYPTTISENVVLRYLREPLDPKWTYNIIVGKELFNPSSSSYQDFELHTSEFSNIVLRMLTYFGINLREAEIVQIAEQLKNSMNVKDNA